jgi:hypothetical protein
MSQRAAIEEVLERLEANAAPWQIDGVTRAVREIREALKTTALPDEEARADAIAELSLRARKAILNLAAYETRSDPVTLEDLQDALDLAKEIRSAEG